jgi:uncharacterized membrane protein
MSTTTNLNQLESEIVNNFDMNKSRLEAFSDGVFAIIITILVLEIKIPELPFDSINNAHLLEKLVENIPMLGSYFLSVAVVASFWLTHHFMFQYHAKNIDRWVVQLNVLSLSVLALIPFSAGVLGRYSGLNISELLYGFNLLAVYLINLCLYEYIWRSKNIENHKLPSRVIKQGKIRLYSSIVCTIIALILSSFSTQIAFVFFVLPLIFNNIPGVLNRLEKMFGFEIK